DPEEPVPLTLAQAAVWNYMSKQGTRLSDLKMCAINIRVLGPLDLSRLRMSVEGLVERHESLRTTLGTRDGAMVQKIGSVRGCHFELVDLQSLPSTRVEQEAKELAQNFADEKVDLTEGPLFSAKVFRLAEHDHVVI